MRVQSRCSVRCSVVTLLHTPHSRMHTPPQEDKCRLLPQPKPVPTEGGGGGGAPPEQDGHHHPCMTLLGSTILNLESTWDLPPPPPLPAACLVLDGWRRQELQVGSDRKG